MLQKYFMRKNLIIVFLLFSFHLSAQSLVSQKLNSKPKLNGPKTIGIKSGATILHTLPITGERPLELVATGLPSGLKLSATAGTITGRVTKKGEYNATISIKNSKGKTEENIKIIVGDQVALTPPMGWDGGEHYEFMDQGKLKHIYESMMKYDLINHGYNYIIIPDSWQGKRGGKHMALMPDSSHYPDLKKTIDHLHHEGFKVGLYSTPWVLSPKKYLGGSADSADGIIVRHQDFTKDRRIGKYSFHKQDAKQWADWGIDLIKYEWQPLDIRNARLMSEELKKNHKDILLWASGNASYLEASEWQRIANIWNTTERDLQNWDSLKVSDELQEQWSPFTGPGHWPNPGRLGADSYAVGKLNPTPLSQAEKMTQFTMWSLLSAPLFLQGDMSELDDFTVSLITNDEVIAIDQDAQGIQARKVFSKDQTLALAKSLQDGSIALGLFNKDNVKKKISVTWSDLGITGTRLVRDVWMQHDLGKLKDLLEIEVPPHGVVLVKIIKP